MILYEVLNEQPDVLAERTYSVWPDSTAACARPRTDIEVGPSGRPLLPLSPVESQEPVGAREVLEAPGSS